MVFSEIQLFVSSSTGPHLAANNKAKQAAFYVYSDTYATTRAAYVRAIFFANQIQDPNKRLLQFKSSMSARLNNDLMYDNISPSFLLQIMCTMSLRVMAGLMLLAGLVAIALVTCGTVALPFLPTIAMGGTSTVLGASLFGGSFFARQQHRKLDEANQNRMDIGLPA